MKPSRLSAVLIVAAAFAAVPASAAAATSPCDTIDKGACMLPYPNDFFTRKSTKTPTKRILNLSPLAVPKNKAGKPIDVTEWNLLDGFSPGSMIVTYVPGLNLTTSKVPSLTAPTSWQAADAGVVVIDKTTRQRWPIYAEIDLQAATPINRDLIIRPLTNFIEGHTYVVALRNMKDGAGNAITPNKDFIALRDNKAKGTLALRKTEFSSIFAATTAAGIPRSSLYRAWQFTVASTKSLTGRLLSMRDQAFSQLGDTNLADRTIQGNSPSFEITRVINYGPSDDEYQYLSRRVYGKIDVPCFLRNNGCRPGSTLNIGTATGLPRQIAGNIDKAPFVCNIPKSVAEGDTVKEPGFSVTYGHGLVGNYEAITGNDAYAKAGQDYKNVFCGLDWQGMATEDLTVIGIGILPDLSNFKMLPDRLQQAHLNYMYLGRALAHPSGLGANAAFQFGGQSALSGQVGYSGDSQGGILGGATMAVSPDFRWGSLGVPAINYSTLLDRSVDWPVYAAILYSSYGKDSKERPLLMTLIQQLWDRGEADGYAQHIGRNPLPNTPTNTVLLLPAYGDHQVSNFAVEVYARTIGAKLRTPALHADRWGPFRWFWGITDGGSGPITGNAMLMMDTGPARAAACTASSCAANPLSDPDPCNAGRCKGTPPPPVGNVPPAYGQDPHGVGGDSAEIRRIVSSYIRTGTLPAGCDGAPCGIGGWVPGS